jgi:diaminopimelate decarboxylase
LAEGSVAYHPDERIPSFEAFAEALALVKDFSVLLEPGRSIIADAGF